jgi:primosomal protein N'
MRCPACATAIPARRKTCPKCKARVTTGTAAGGAEVEGGREAVLEAENARLREELAERTKELEARSAELALSFCFASTA